MGGRLPEKGITALREGAEGRVFAGQVLRRGAEEGETGGELEGVDTAAHQVFERSAALKLLVDGADDFFVAGTEERIAEVSAGFRQIAEGIGAGS